MERHIWYWISIAEEEKLSLLHRLIRVDQRPNGWLFETVMFFMASNSLINELHIDMDDSGACWDLDLDLIIDIYGKSSYFAH